MKIIAQNNLSHTEREFVYRLWNQEYPRTLSYKTTADLEAYLKTLEDPIFYFALDTSDNPVAWSTLFNREGERWFAMIVADEAQRNGIGGQLLERMKEKERSLYAWAIDHFDDVKSNGEIYLSPLPFYLRNGFTICHGERFPSDILSAVKIMWKRPTPDQRL